MYKGQSIAVIIPCLNEEQGVEKVLRALPEFVDEIIVVDNASTDRTSDVARTRSAPKSSAKTCAATAAVINADSPSL